MLIGVKETARRLNVALPTVRRFCRIGKLRKAVDTPPPYLFFTEEDVERCRTGFMQHEWRPRGRARALVKHG